MRQEAAAPGYNQLSSDDLLRVLEFGELRAYMALRVAGRDERLSVEVAGMSAMVDVLKQRQQRRELADKARR